MALTDIMTVDLNGFSDSSSSSSLASDSDSESDDVSSEEEQSSSSSQGRRGTNVSVALSDAEGGDSDLEPPNQRKKPVFNRKAPMTTKSKPTTKPPPQSKLPVTVPSRNDSSSSSPSNSSDSSSSSSMASENDTNPSKNYGASHPASALRGAKIVAKSDDPKSLKFTLKLPPGFVAKQSEPTAKPISNNSRAKGATSKVPTMAPNASKPTVSGTKRARASPQKKSSSATSAKARKQPSRIQQLRNSAASVAPSFSTPPPPPSSSTSSSVLHRPPITNSTNTGGPIIPPKLIPVDGTMPKEEIRGRNEGALANIMGYEVRPVETQEECIPALFNESSGVDSDVLRNLDLFFFCDEEGNPVKLDILEKSRHERPRIVGYGTVIQPLAHEDKPIPVKYILPSPLFPSRTKKRGRNVDSDGSPTNSGADPPWNGSRKYKRKRKAPAAGGGARTTRLYKKKGVEPSAAPMPQMDGTQEEEDELAFSSSNRTLGEKKGTSIFQEQTTVSYGQQRRRRGTIGQFDGPYGWDSHNDSTDSSLEDDSSDLSSDDSDSSGEGKSGSTPGLNGSASGGQGNGGGESSDSSSDDGSEAKPSASTSASNGTKPVTTVTSSSTKENLSKKASAPAPKKPLAKSLEGGSVQELMRVDGKYTLDVQGSEDTLNLLECGFRYPSENKRLRVRLPDILDWCLDYSDGDPTLWVITEYAWYKVAGPLSGLLPHPSYRKTFTHVRMLLEASYWVQYVLKEWLPLNRKVSYRATLQQIISLSLKSRYPVSARFLVENFHFIKNQILDLVQDKEMYEQSMLFRQLQRMYLKYKQKSAKAAKDQEEKERKRLKKEAEKRQRKAQVEEEKRKLRDQREEERKLKEEERKYPIEDLELLAEEKQQHRSKGEGGNGLMLDQNIDHILSVASVQGLEGKLLGELITIWQTIGTFKTFLGLESAIPLETLASCLTSSTQGATRLVLNELFLVFLRVILSEKSFSSLMEDLVVEGNVKVSDLFATSNERTYGIGERPYVELLNVVTWQEVLRQLMSKDLGVDSSLGLVEPLVGCEIVRQTLYMQTSSQPFNIPVDTTLKGLEDYAKIVKRPMDLGTIKSKLEKGEYEESGAEQQPKRYEQFAADVRQIWENATLYNGEDSEIGRAALALSEIFEQDFQRLVIDPVKANEERLAACERIKTKLLTANEQHVENGEVVEYQDIAYGLYSFDYYELPVTYKIGALSWVCAEFLKLDSIRKLLETNAEWEVTIMKEQRKKIFEVEARRKQAEKERKEVEAEFRKECISQGVHPNSQNVFSETIKQEHVHIAKFYAEFRQKIASEEAEYAEEKARVEQETAETLSKVTVREKPVGKDRFHNTYWIFSCDEQPRLFVEKSDSGVFLLLGTPEELESLLRWLNPKGIRELHLRTKLLLKKDQLLEGITQKARENPLRRLQWKGSNPPTREINLFPLPNPAIDPELLEIEEGPNCLDANQIVSKMLRCLEEHLVYAGTISKDWSKSTQWLARLMEARDCQRLRELLDEIEECLASKKTRNALNTVRHSWMRKRREWRLALLGSCTAAQLAFLINSLLCECINVEAFVDFYIQLDRKEWLKLRAKECRNFIPEVGKRVLYFGEGHAQALKEDAKVKKKRFTQSSDAPLGGNTVVVEVCSMTYHHGGGDPYALVVLEPVPSTAEATDSLCPYLRQPGAFLCSEPSASQRLSRIIMRIVSKLKAHADAVPFLEPVSTTEFPEYKEIIPEPMDLSRMTMKVKANAYKSVVDFQNDIELMRSNCQVFCEDRFPTIPPLAKNLQQMTESYVKKFAKEIRACEDASAPIKSNVIKSEQEGGQVKKEEEEEALKKCDSNGEKAVFKHFVSILRLENRLPEYLVDMKRYETALAKEWKPGQKFRILFRDAQGFPGEFYCGTAAGSLPFEESGLLPWEALRVVWDEDDGADDSRINPWEAEFVSDRKKMR